MVLSKVFMLGEHISISMSPHWPLPKCPALLLNNIQVSPTAICNSQALALQLHPFLQPLPKRYQCFMVSGPRASDSRRALCAVSTSLLLRPGAWLSPTKTKSAMKCLVWLSLLSQAGVSFPPNVKTKVLNDPK